MFLNIFTTASFTVAPFLPDGALKWKISLFNGDVLLLNSVRGKIACTIFPDLK